MSRQNDNEFSIENILKAAKNEKRENTDLNDEQDDKWAPIQFGTHRAPHALTPEEVIGQSAVSSSSEIKTAAAPEQQFVIYESDIMPDAGAPEQAKEKIEFSLNNDDSLKTRTSKYTEAPKSTDASSKPAEKEQYTVVNDSFYERMKELHTDEPSADIDTSEPDYFSLKPQVAKPTKKAVVSPKVVTPRRVHTESEMSVEELIKYAEEKAEKAVQRTYQPRIKTVGKKPAAYFESKLRGETPAEDKVRPAIKAEESETRFAPVNRAVDFSRQEPAHHVINVKTAEEISSDRRGERSITEQATDVESFSSGVYSHQTLKVTPVKRSRIFITPTSDDAVTPAQKSVAKEIPINVDLVDKSLENNNIDRRIEKHTPYASQYSLADADLPNKDSVFIQPKPTITEDDEERDIVSSIAAVVNAVKSGEELPPKPIQEPVTGHETDNEVPLGETENSEIEGTIQFDSIDDFDVEKMFPPDDQSDENPADGGRKKFRLFGSDEPKNNPDEIPEEEFEADDSDDIISDYDSIEDKAAVEDDLTSKIGRLIARLVPTVIITIVLFALSSPVFSGFSSSNSTAAFTLCLILSAVAAAINFRTMKGLISLVTFRPDFDSPAALAVFASLASGIISAVSGGNFALTLIALGGLALCGNLVGKLICIKTIRRNFNIIANDETKKSMILLDDNDITSQIACGSVLGEALIYSGRDVKHAENFLKNSFKKDPYEKTVGKIMLLGIIAAVTLAVIVSIGSGIVTGVACAAAVICLTCAPSSFLLANLPMAIASKRLNYLDSEISDYTAADDFSFANAITLNVNDLFPEGTVKLFNMHILSHHPIDQSILEAASLCKSVNSPLSQIFTDMISDGIKLPVIDTITYENKMGLSGWIGEKRIFFGNRTLMETHAIPLPSLDVDKRILRSGYFPVYLASTEGPAALFIVGYEADEEISYQLRRLSATGVTLLINTCDQNINEDMICDYFELYPESVKIISQQVTKIFNQATAPTHDGDSSIVCKGDAAGIAASLTASIRIKEDYSASLILHIILTCIGVAGVCALAINGNLSLINSLFLGGYQVLSTAIISAVPLLKRP